MAGQETQITYVVELGANLKSKYPQRNKYVSRTKENISAWRNQWKNKDVYISIFQYASAEVVQSLKIAPLYYDFDHEENPQLALDDIRNAIKKIQKKVCPDNAIRCYFSGHKGFHLEIAYQALGIEPCIDLAERYRALGIEAKKFFKTLDIVVYEQKRLWRLPNSIHPATELYKIPLTITEINSLSIEAIQELAKKPRWDFTYQTPDKWANFKEIFEKTKKQHTQANEAKSSVQLKELIGVTQGSRDNSMLSLTESLLSRRYNEAEVWETITQVNQTYQPPLDDASMQRLFRQATNFILSNSSATNGETYNNINELSQETKLKNPTLQGSVNSRMSQDAKPYPKLLSELSAEKLSVAWIWEGFIVKGHKTLLSALFKAGKSTWIGLFLKAIEQKTEFLGYATQKCNILILTEESESQWVTRRDDLGLQSNIYIISNPLKNKLNYADWVQWLEEIKQICKERTIELVIIDTLSEFWSVNDENKAPEVTQALMPLNYLTEDNIAVLLVHHFRKSGGTQGTAARGSGALASKVDILIDFTRYENDETTTKRRLSCLSRFEETPRELVIDYIQDDYIVLGSSAEVNEKEKLASLLIIFRAYTEGFTVKEVYATWDISEYGKKPAIRTLQRYIAKLIRAELVEKIEDKIIKGKLTPCYKVITPRQDDEGNSNNPLSQENEPTEVQAEAHSSLENSNNSEESIDTQKIVAGIKEFKSQTPLTPLQKSKIQTNESINASSLDDKTLKVQEIDTREKLRNIKKETPQYSQIYPVWFALRLEGEKRGLWSFIPTPNE